MKKNKTRVLHLSKETLRHITGNEGSIPVTMGTVCTSCGANTVWASQATNYNGSTCDSLFA